MRHLRVPSEETQHWLDFCRQKGWLMSGAGVLPLEEGHRGIPLTDLAPDEGEVCWSGNTIFSDQGLTRGPGHWMDRLDEQILNKFAHLMPKSHEIQGDILIVKIDDLILDYSEQIAHAMLEQFPSIRLVCADNGVSGDFRVRNLLPIISRDGNLSTRTKIREHGKVIWTDPAKAYFSARLSNERMQNLVSAKDLRDRLNVKIRICDPYAGVGPGIMPLLSEPDLVSHCYAGDLNPDAFELLELNLQESFSKTQTTHAEVILKNQDARNWKSDENYLEQIDLLLVNLPHDSIDHLPDLIPLLSRGSLTKIRGWAIINKDELNNSQQKITEILENFNADVESVSCSEVKGFSSSKIFMRFETIQLIP